MGRLYRTALAYRRIPTLKVRPMIFKVFIYLCMAYMIYAMAPDGWMQLVYWPLIGMVAGIWLICKIIGAIF